MSLAARLEPVPVRLCDERLSTVTAEGQLRAQGRKGKKRRAVVDQAAAVVILQGALERERQTGSAAGEQVAPEDQSTTGTATREPHLTTAGTTPTTTRTMGTTARRAAGAAQAPGPRLPAGPARAGRARRAASGSAVGWAYDEISARLASAPDYAGPGTGEVLYEVQEGATSAQIGRELKAKGVVEERRRLHRGRPVTRRSRAPSRSATTS